MALATGDRVNFETLLRAVRANDVALVECSEPGTLQPIAVICAMQSSDHGEIEMVPLARLFSMNPYKTLHPPQ